ncbi:MAG TPA: thiamine pyrophosphate-binding protein [Thermodesulfobacteriota bacterium]|nr:thiamine pyrophosphate-binding protein [Thermodesulfobacteriota bacterium]
MKSIHETGCGEALLHLLETQHIDFIFCSPLSVWAPLWEALARKQAAGSTTPPTYINCRHEVLAAGLAAGCYKTTGRMQTILLPTALGVLNAAMAIRGAYQERVPMVVMAPDSFTFGEMPGRDPGMEWPPLLGDLGGPARIAEGYVKWAKEVKTALELPAAFRRACYIAESVPRGPVLLSIPFEILIDSIPFQHQQRIVPYPLVAADEALKAVAQLIVSASEPIIITDHAGRSGQNIRTLTSLAELIGAPVFEFWMPTCTNIASNHPLHGEGMVEEMLETADCILAIASDAPWHPADRKLKRNCSVIVIEEDPMRPRASHWGYKTDYCIAGDVGANLAGLVRHVKSSFRKKPDAVAARDKRLKRWQTHNERRRKEFILQANETIAGSSDIHAVQLFQTLDALLPKDAIIVDEIIAQLNLMMKVLFQRNSYQHYRGLIAGGLGMGISTALGVKLADPQRTVVCIIGDGSFSYNPIPACFGIAQQYRLPLLVIICNNQGYASQSWNTFKYFPDGWSVKTNTFLGSTIEPTPEYSALASGFAGYGERVDHPDDLESALRRGLDAVQSGRLAVIDVLLKP